MLVKSCLALLSVLFLPTLSIRKRDAKSTKGSGKKLVVDESVLSEIREAIPKCFYINLDHRTDRKERLEQNMARFGLTCDRVPAIKANDDKQQSAEKACLYSHIKAMKSLIATDAPYGLILEDDAVWKEEVVARAPALLKRIPQVMSSHPAALLACNGYAGHKSETEGFKNINVCQTTSAYLVKREYAPKLLEVWENATTVDGAGACTDQAWKVLQRPDQWVMADPLLIKQGASYSDIMSATVNYGMIELAETRS